MNETSTTENLILYLFNETGMTESVLIQQQIDYDPETEAEFENIKSTFNVLDQALATPSAGCLNRILAFASNPSN